MYCISWKFDDYRKLNKKLNHFFFQESLWEWRMRALPFIGALASISSVQVRIIYPRWWARRMQFDRGHCRWGGRRTKTTRVILLEVDEEEWHRGREFMMDYPATIEETVDILIHQKHFHFSSCIYLIYFFRKFFECFRCA